MSYEPVGAVDGLKDDAMEHGGMRDLATVSVYECMIHEGSKSFTWYAPCSFFVFGAFFVPLVFAVFVFLLFCVFVCLATVEAISHEAHMHREEGRGRESERAQCFLRISYFRCLYHIHFFAHIAKHSLLDSRVFFFF